MAIKPQIQVALWVVAFFFSITLFAISLVISTVVIVECPDGFISIFNRDKCLNETILHGLSEGNPVRPYQDMMYPIMYICVIFWLVCAAKLIWIQSSDHPIDFRYIFN